MVLTFNCSLVSDGRKAAILFGPFPSLSCFASRQHVALFKGRQLGKLRSNAAINFRQLNGMQHHRRVKSAKSQLWENRHYFLVRLRRSACQRVEQINCYCRLAIVDYFANLLKAKSGRDKEGNTTNQISFCTLKVLENSKLRNSEVEPVFSFKIYEAIIDNFIDFCQVQKLYVYCIFINNI